MKNEIYISHAWEPQSDEILYPLIKRLQQEKFNIIYDHKDLGYRGSITQFMDDLAESEAIIIIVSNKYLKSEYCMYELLKIYEQKDIQNRIYPIVLSEVNIAKSTDRLNLVKYWEKEAKDLMNKIKELDDITFLEGITDDLNLYKSIRNKIAKLTHILKDINTLQVHTHKESNFKELVDALKANRLHKRTNTISIPKIASHEIRNSLKPVMILVPVLLISILGLYYYKFKPTDEGKPEVEKQLLSDNLLDHSSKLNTDSSPVNMLSSNIDTQTIEDRSSTIQDSNDPDPEEKTTTVYNQPKENRTESPQRRPNTLSKEQENLDSRQESENVKLVKQQESEWTDSSLALNGFPESQKLQSENASRNDEIVEEVNPADKVTYRELILSRKTPVFLKPKKRISSANLSKGDRIYFEVTDAILSEDTKLIEKSATAVGLVERVQSFQNSNRAILEFNIQHVEAIDGSLIPLNMTFSKTNRKFDISINPEQLIEATTRQDEKIMGQIIH